MPKRDMRHRQLRDSEAQRPRGLEAPGCPGGHKGPDDPKHVQRTGGPEDLSQTLIRTIGVSHHAKRGQRSEIQRVVNHMVR